MADAKPNKLTAQAPQVDPKGPEIVYVGEGAEKIKFKVNPKARKYVVRSDGQILESF